VFNECLWIPDLFPEADWLIWDPEAYIHYPTTQITCFHIHCNTLLQFLPKQIFEYNDYVGRCDIWLHIGEILYRWEGERTLKTEQRKRWVRDKRKPQSNDTQRQYGMCYLIAVYEFTDEANFETHDNVNGC